MHRLIGVVLLALIAGGCAAKPVLYPNAHLKDAGSEQDAPHGRPSVAATGTDAGM